MGLVKKINVGRWDVESCLELWKEGCLQVYSSSFMSGENYNGSTRHPYD